MLRTHFLTPPTPPSREPQQNGNWEKLFPSGGAGYILDKLALETLISVFDEPFCQPHLRGFWEDVMVAQCLKKSPATLLPQDTRDSQGRERCHINCTFYASNKM